MRSRAQRAGVRYVLSVVCGISAMTIAAPASDRPLPGSFEETLDLRSLPTAKTWRTVQASGHDRDGGFYDSGNFLRIDNGNHYVLMETHGPGCIDRMWFTYKKPIGEEPYELLVYVDDPASPAIRVNLDALFTGAHPPFVPPLAGVCGLPRQPGRFSYVPIGFTRYCKVVLHPSATLDRYNYRTNSAGQRIPHVYYQITGRRFPPGTAVKPFSWRLSGDEQAALQRAKRLWEARGASPWDRVENLRHSSGTITLEPGEPADLFQAGEQGVIYALRLHLDDPSGVQLAMTWDAAARPQVLVPLGPFFACDEGVRPGDDVRGLWTGYAEGWYYCYLPMPFHKGARVSLILRTGPARTVEYDIAHRSEPVAPDQGWLCAHRYDHNPPPPGQDYEVLDVEGCGHFIGLVMDRPGHMEGDDRFFVDGQASPAIHGTGTEDFFNFAWGLSHTGALALHGITIQNGHPVAYRFHVPAAVPFDRSLRITWEHGHDPDRGPNHDAGRYSGVVFYYLRAAPGRLGP